MASRRSSRDADAAGVDGLIIVDLPPEEDEELCLPALQGRAQFHPPGDADDRRQAPAGGARQHIRVRLLRVDHRRDRRRGGRSGQGRRRGCADQASYPFASGGRLRRQGRARARRRSPASPTAWWSVRRWSRRCAARWSTARRGLNTVDAGRAPGADARRGRAQRRQVRPVRHEHDDELDLQRRSAEDPFAAAARDAGKSVGQMPGERPAGVPQGPRGQPDGGAGLRLPHGDRAAGAAGGAVRRRRL